MSPLRDTTRKLLHHLQLGCTIDAHRLYPGPWHFSLINPGGTRANDGVMGSDILTLVERGHAECIPAKDGDRAVYRVTQAGLRASTAKVPPPDPTQLVIDAVAPFLAPARRTRRSATG